MAGPRDDEPGAHEPGAHEPSADVPGADVPGADVPGADVPGADVPGADVPGAHVPGADVPGAHESGADEPGATEWAVPGQVGVGPWPGDPADWPTDGRYDPELLAGGDRRNVVDAYRYWRRDAVAVDLAARAHPFHIAIENFGHDHNIGTVVRTANAFGAAGVHIVGRRRWNRRGAMVTDRYLAVYHHNDLASLVAFARDHDLVVVAVDNTPGAQRLETARLPRACLLLFGQEGPGLTARAHTAAQMTVSIAHFGSTRSINAGVAAGIAMHTWVLQHADLTRAW